LKIKPTGGNASGLVRRPRHHGSHKDLLVRPSVIPSGDRSVDAIVVPTARRPISMAHAIHVAGTLGCPLVALCSKWSSADGVKRLANASGIQIIAIDIDRFPAALQPTLATSELLVGTRFERRMDLSDKRNFGLLLAHLLGWQRIVFLDDDIEVPEPADLTDAVRLLDSYSAVGLTIGGFPDNSVVCRAYRESGGEQDTFVGGGALAVRTDRLESLFPNIYNEDWFYLIDQARRRQVAITGRVVQRPYDPFSERRARSEELGDCLAEGIFALLDDDALAQAVVEDYWADFLADRWALIEETMRKVGNLDRSLVEKQQMVTALKAARGRSQCITPKLCVDYVRAWQKDRIQWADHVSRLTQADLAGLPELSDWLGARSSAA
jgi:hypothetical protein